MGINNGICNSCDKGDICKYKAEMLQVMKETSQISERNNMFTINIRCKKWSDKNETDYIECPVVSARIDPRCMHLVNFKYCNNKNGCRYQIG